MSASSSDLKRQEEERELCRKLVTATSIEEVRAAKEKDGTTALHACWQG
jgi:hypothetical protein